MSYRVKTPVALMIFNRPEPTERVFAEIAKVRPSKLLVVADGPRLDRPDEEARCRQTRSIVERVDWECDVLTQFAATNLGCRRRVSTGLDWVFQTVEEAIILEDDCLPDWTFFRFCDELIERYRHDTRIGMISGDNFLRGRRRSPDSYYFTRNTHIWGWATWRRAWRHYDVDMHLWPQVRDGGWLHDFLGDEAAAQYWTGVFDRTHRGEIDTWDYQWQFACWIQNHLSIQSDRNLISNLGFGPEATHTTGPSPFANMPVEAMDFPLRHPSGVIRNALADTFTDHQVFGIPTRPVSDSWYSRLDAPPQPAPVLERGIPMQASAHPVSKATVQDTLDLLNQHRNIEALSAIAGLAETAGLPALAYGKAVALARTGCKQAALEVLEGLLEAMPTHRKAVRLLEELSVDSVPDLMRQMRDALSAGQPLEAFHLGIAAKALKQPTLGLDVLRAVSFEQLGRLDEAREALREELRHFPSNREAHAMIERLLPGHLALVSGRIGDAEFQAILREIRPFTMLSEERLYSIYSLARRACELNLPGNFVECGVAGGGSTALLATVIRRYSQQPRWVYSFDSFEGMPTPTAEDTHQGIGADDTGWGTGTCAAPMESVQTICQHLGVWDLVRPVKGYFCDTLPKMRDWVGMIAFLHMDADWYESTKDILVNLYDRLINDALIQVDDYGYWEGCPKALHEFETARGLKFELHSIDGTGVWFQKPDRFPMNPAIDRGLFAEFEQDDPVLNGFVSQMSPNERFQMYTVLREHLKSGPKRTVEIGSYFGGSLFLTYRALERMTPDFQCFSIDAWVQPPLASMHQMLSDRVVPIEARSEEAAPALREVFERDGSFPEFIFVDGDHSYEGVRADILNYYPLLQPGGIMMFHDYLPPIDEHNRDAIFFHHGKDPGIRQAVEELMVHTYGCEPIDLPLLYPTDPTQTQAHIPIIPNVYSTVRAYRKPV